MFAFEIDESEEFCQDEKIQFLRKSLLVSNVDFEWAIIQQVMGLNPRQVIQRTLKFEIMLPGLTLCIKKTDYQFIHFQGNMGNTHSELAQKLLLL